MGSAANSRFAISRNKQSDKDTMVVTKMVSYPFQWQSGFKISPAVDSFNDLVESRWENSLVQILGAPSAGQVSFPANTDLLALLLSSMMATIVSTLIGVGQTFTCVSATDVCTAAAHGLTTGQRVTVSTSSALPGGLTVSTVYFVRVIDINTFKLYATQAAAKQTGGTAVDLTDTGTGTQTITPEIYQHTITPTAVATPNFHTCSWDDGTCERRIVGTVPTSVAIAANSIKNPRMSLQAAFAAIRQDRNDLTLAAVCTAATTDIVTSAGHGLQTGDAVTLSNSGGALPAGTAAATIYFVRVIDANTFYLHLNWIDAVEAQNTVDITGAGTGVHTVTAYVLAMPTQEEVNPIMFTQSGAALSITVDDGAATSYLAKWAGFDYSLQDAIDSEQRAGSNALRVIEKQGRAQSLNLLIDYNDSTWKDVIQKYQASTVPPKIKVDLTVRGKVIGNNTYHSLSMTFYNTNLTDHNYNAQPGIGKQHLPLKVNDSIADGKSSQVVIVNDIALYLA